MTYIARGGFRRERWFSALLLAAAAVVAGCGGPPAETAEDGPPKLSDTAPTTTADATVTPQTRPAPVDLHIDPFSTAPGIASETAPERQHHVVVAEDSNDNPRGLVVFLGGALSVPGHYTELVAHVAGLGYAVINLRYPNEQLIGVECFDKPNCFAMLRGEITYGVNTPDPGDQMYDSDLVDVDATNSISGRLVALLQHLGAEDPYWNQFLVADPSSPYHGNQAEPARPAWDAITISGHSQGSGHAAFLAMSTPIRRVVVFSGPNDNNAGTPATWITSPSATPLDRYYGLRSADEGILGPFAGQNWKALGGADNGLPGDPVDIGDGSGPPHESHHLVLAPPTSGDSFAGHLSTATDMVHAPSVTSAWTYVFTAPTG